MPSAVRALVASIAIVTSLAACGGAASNALPSARSTDGLDSAAATNERVGRSTAASVKPGLKALVLEPPAGSIYLGAQVDPAPQLHQTGAQRVAALEAQIGRTLALDDHYYGWNTHFPAAQEADDAAHNRIPVVAWNCAYSNASVAAGTHDSDIIATATAIKAYGHPLFLRWFWEMDLPVTANSRTACWDAATDLPGGYFDPTHFVAAWQHIRAVFAAQSVTNVVWLWTPSTRYAHQAATLAPYFPGDAAVDWVGSDIYAPTAGETFTQTYAAMYATLTSLSAKPILAAETATIATNQATWFSGADAILAATFPNIKGIMYFDAQGGRGWTLTPTGLNQFKTFAHSAYLAAVPKL